MPTFEEVAASLDQIKGVKAVWGRSSEPVMCFGTRGDESLKNPGHFQQARVTAEKAILRPYLVTIEGGAEVGKELSGRVVGCDMKSLPVSGRRQQAIFKTWRAP